MTPHPHFSSTARASLGTSVELVHIGWQRVTEAYPDLQVRAHLTLGSGDFSTRTFCWKNGQIQRLISAESFQPVSRSDLEWIDACIEHGYLFIYQIRPGREPVILHAIGEPIPLEHSSSSRRETSHPAARAFLNASTREATTAHQEKSEGSGNALPGVSVVVQGISVITAIETRRSRRRVVFALLITGLLSVGTIAVFLLSRILLVSLGRGLLLHH